MNRGEAAIREAYRDEGVARRYVDERFREPLGALLHARQARALRRVLAASRPRGVLEIAPGPARLTVEIAPYLPRGGTIVDASRQMLLEARRRLEGVGPRWRLVLGDAFALPFGRDFDLVTTFRLVRHFEAADRRRLYEQIRRVLRPDGRLVFDAVNEVVSAPLRARARPGEYAHYDALFRREDLERELDEAGFEIERLEGVQRRYELLARIQVLVAPRSRPLARLLMEAVDRTGGRPLEWIVVARRR